MKVEELFKTIEPMVEQVDKRTALFMLGCDDEKECGAIKGKAEVIINMLVTQMVRDESIERVIMVAAEAFIDFAEHMKKKADKTNTPNVS